MADVVSAVHYLATRADQVALLDYLDEPRAVSLHRWPVLPSQSETLHRDDALITEQVMVVHRDLGTAMPNLPGHKAMEAANRSGLFNRLNWERLRPGPGESLVDSNASPVLLWTPGAVVGSAIYLSAIGSQADAMGAVSPEYETWVRRVMGWVRRRGTKVWGLERHGIRPDLDIRLAIVSNVYAMPGALAALEHGGYGTAQ
ncbi:hypothetical protein [Pimelobacter sp. 30-1]|uniref:hypothetical protein n=1 Tax=Pimelobacter sp. 30-1 TaxID=2004991 RepID=UPI001C053148|nr:hypothetical protein [Pimelobacter sp. 30-1]MBU2698204.1 hypothetical protein [Pimelobacter sp. 30-1]